MLEQCVNKSLKYPDDMEPVFTHLKEPGIKEENIGEITNEKLHV